VLIGQIPDGPPHGRSTDETDPLRYEDVEREFAAIQIPFLR
jgi:hypothetical protein